MKRLVLTFVIAVGLLLFMTGCGSEPQLTTTRHHVVVPDESMYSCQRFSNWPETSRLTSAQVSRTLVELYSVNEQCYNSQQALRRFLEDARTRIQSGATQ